MIQITPQMRVLVAIESVDGRNGIDSLARLCQDKLQVESFFRMPICIYATADTGAVSTDLCKPFAQQKGAQA